MPVRHKRKTRRRRFEFQERRKDVHQSTSHKPLTDDADETSRIDREEPIDEEREDPSWVTDPPPGAETSFEGEPTQGDDLFNQDIAPMVKDQERMKIRPPTLPETGPQFKNGNRYPGKMAAKTTYAELAASLRQAAKDLAGAGNS